MLDAESTLGNKKTHGLAFTKFTFKLEHIDSTETNETNNTIRDYGNSYEGHKKETLDNTKGNTSLNYTLSSLQFCYYWADLYSINTETSFWKEMFIGIRQ